MEQNWAEVEIDTKGVSVIATVNGNELLLLVQVENPPHGLIEFEKIVKIRKGQP